MRTNYLEPGSPGHGPTAVECRGRCRDPRRLDSWTLHEDPVAALAKGRLAEIPIQHDLETLRKQLTALERLAGEQPGSNPAQIAAIVADLLESCERMQVHSGRLHATEAETLLALQEAVARKAAILDASLDAVITIDHRGLVVEFNSAAESMFGYRREYAVGRVLSDLAVPPRLKQQALEGLERCRTGGAASTFGRRFEAFAVNSNGTEFPVEVAVSPIGSGDPPLLTIYISNATARRQAEHDVRRSQRRLRALTAELLLTEERERRRLAIDLHDGFSQTIALARIKLSALRPALAGARAGLLDEIAGLIEQADRSARSISFELSPPMLHDMGLEPAVQWLVENIHARYGIVIVLEDDGQTKPTDEKMRVILFRSIRELLINAAKHARACTVSLRLFREEESLGVSVDDDGVGMEQGAGDEMGFGLFSIRERMSHVGGTMSIDSVVGRGTRIVLRAPLASGLLSKVGEQA